MFCSVFRGGVIFVRIRSAERNCAKLIGILHISGEGIFVVDSMQAFKVNECYITIYIRHHYDLANYLHLSKKSTQYPFHNQGHSGPNGIEQGLVLNITKQRNTAIFFVNNIH